MSDAPAPAVNNPLCPTHHRMLRGPEHHLYCPSCASVTVSPFMFAGQLTRWLRGAGLAAGIIAVVAFCGLLPFHLGMTAEGRDSFYLLLIVPVTFLVTLLASAVAGVLGRVTRRFSGRRVMGYWYDPMHRAADTLLLAMAAACGYGALWLANGVLHFLGSPANREEDWFVRRFVFLAAAVGLGLWFLTRAGWVARAGFTPRRRLWFPAMLYGLLIPLFYLPAQSILIDDLKGAALAKSVSSSPTLFCLFASLAVALPGAVWWERLRLEQERAAARASGDMLGVLSSGEIETYVAILGPSQCGKSTFLACAHQLLKSLGAIAGEVSLSTGAPGKELTELIRNIYERRQLRSQTVEPELNQLVIELLYTAKIHVNWLDIPGGLISNFESYTAANQQAFLDRLANAEALVMMVQASDLLAGQEIGHLSRAAARFQEGLTRQSGPARRVPLAIIVTQVCRLTAREQSALRRRHRQLLENVILTWENGCRRNRMPAEVRVFLSSAVATRAENNHQIPMEAGELVHDQVVEPLYWLAAQVTRAHMEHLAFALPTEQAALRRQVLWLEEQADSREWRRTPLPRFDDSQLQAVLSLD